MIAIRRLGIDDWRAFRAVRLAALAESPGNFFRPLAEEQAAPDCRWIDLLSGDRQALFGLFDGDRMVGITGVFTSREDPIVAEFGMTWIDPVWRGRGLSALFYGARVDWARANRFDRIEVSHRRTNETSRRAMLAAGFRQTGIASVRWPDGETDDNFVYELALR